MNLKSCVYSDQMTETQKNSRRNRKDPESRDFTCRCGKGYLSYAAAYTHVKHKHNLDKIFLENIGKPQRQKLPRGRPKYQKQSEVDSDVEELSILEEGILKMYQMLHSTFEKMILEGNESVDKSALDAEYKALIDHFHLDEEQMNGEMTDHESKFLRDFCRHFTIEVAARVKMVVLELIFAEKGKVQSSERQESKKIALLNGFNLWNGQNEVNQLIFQTFRKWKAIRHQA